MSTYMFNFKENDGNYKYNIFVTVKRKPLGK